MTCDLRLVAARLSATASLLELAALVLHVGLDVAVGHTRRAEVLDRLTVALGAAQENDILARRRGERERNAAAAVPTYSPLPS